jgi:hypothetical protein
MKKLTFAISIYTILTFNLTYTCAPFTFQYCQDIARMLENGDGQPVFTLLEKLHEQGGHINATCISTKDLGTGRIYFSTVIPFLSQLIKDNEGIANERNLDNLAYIVWALKHKANPNLPDHEKTAAYFLADSRCAWTPLAATTNPEVAYLLLRYGAVVPDFKSLKNQHKFINLEHTPDCPAVFRKNIIESHSPSACELALQRIEQENEQQDVAIGVLAHQTKRNAKFAVVIAEFLGE